MKVHAACYYECGTCSLICIEVCTSVSDPYWFQYGSGSIILGQYGSGSGSRSVSGFGSRYFRDQNERNLIENFFFLFLSFIAFTHWLGTSRLKLKPSGPQQNGQCSFELEIIYFYPFLDTILTVLDPDPYSQNGSGSGSMVAMIWIRNTGLYLPIRSNSINSDQSGSCLVCRFRIRYQHSICMIFI